MDHQRRHIDHTDRQHLVRKAVETYKLKPKAEAAAEPDAQATTTLVCLVDLLSIC